MGAPLTGRQPDDKHDQTSRSRRTYRPPAGELAVLPPRLVPLPAENEQAALAELLAPLFRPAEPDGAAPPAPETPLDCPYAPHATPSPTCRCCDER